MNPNIEKEEENKFISTLSDFLVTSGVIRHNEKQKIEHISDTLNALELYKSVCRRGGFQSVTNKGMWPIIAKEIGTKDCSKMKSIYTRYLHPYEQKYYFGKDDTQTLPTLICGQPRKLHKTEQKKIEVLIGEVFQQANQVLPPGGALSNPAAQQAQMANQQGVLKSTQYPSQAGQGVPPAAVQTGTLEQELTKQIAAEEKERKAFFINKDKLLHSKAENKKIILGLESYVEKRDVIYSLNMLLLYSVNTVNVFLFENNEKIFSALEKFLHELYPVRSGESLEHLRMATLIFRNLTMNPLNLKFILGTKVFELFVTLFNKGVDPECSKNVIDIMTGLVKVGWDCERIFSDLSQALLDGESEVVRNSIELLRGLVDEREEVLYATVPQNTKSLSRALMSSLASTDIKEQILEILAFVSDAADSREQIASDHELMGVLMSILQHMRKHEKLTQMAALTLNNLSNAVSGKEILRQFENELVVIGFSDDSLAGIIANILADLN